ncbi:MAG: hypothetical protein LH603_18590 [Pseudonocardia sp.]|nr:hypothetical protein [Pseudonocardia sp.]
MSLDVPTHVLTAAERHEMDQAQFVAVVRDSLPYAWAVVTAAAGVAAFATTTVDGDTYREFTSPRGQVLNQSPELRDC